MCDHQPTARLRDWTLAACLAAFSVFGSTPAGAAEGAAPPAAPAHSAYSKAGADTCLDCHDEAAVVGIFKTAHGRPSNDAGPFGHGQLQCESCHGPGDLHANGKGKTRPHLLQFGAKALTPKAEQNAQCLTCHRKNAAHWAANAHASNDVSCSDCHKLHQPKDPVREVASQTAVCTTCHQARASDAMKSSHHPLREGKMACSSCHAPHGSTGPAQLKKNSVNETCTSCHAEYRGPYLWEHQPVAEDCSNCHQPHGSSQPAMLKTRAPFLCQQCHEVQGHPAVGYTPDGLPGGSGTQAGPLLLAGSCTNCHSKVHGSNHPSGSKLMR